MRYVVKWVATVRGEVAVEADFPDEAEERAAQMVVETGPWRDVQNADVHAYIGKQTGGVSMFPCDVVSVPKDAATATGMYDHDDEN